MRAILGAIHVKISGYPFLSPPQTASANQISCLQFLYNPTSLLHSTVVKTLHKLSLNSGNVLIWEMGSSLFLPALLHQVIN